MKTPQNKPEIKYRETSPDAPINGVQYGKIVRLDTELGLAWVDYPGNPFKEILPARVDEKEISFAVLMDAETVNHMAMLSFPNGNLAKPVIVDVFYSQKEQHQKTVNESEDKVIHVSADKIVLDASKELVLKCGDVITRYSANLGERVEEAKSVRSTAIKRYRVQAGAVLIN